MASEGFDLIVRGGTCVTHRGTAEADIGVRDGRIAAVGDMAGASADVEIDAARLHVLPGAVDTQVHMREPGFEHKEDFESGTRAAVLGGITAVFDMPNTNPATVDADALADKVTRVNGRARCDFAFFVGATKNNLDTVGDLERLPGCCGIKVFMGRSTGDLLVSEEADLERVLASGRRRMAIHAEDNDRLEERKALLGEDAWVGMHPMWRDDISALRATERIVKLAHRIGRRIHVLHVSTGKEMAFLAEHRDVATVETTPQHLTLVAPECYDQLGTLAQMNPPIRGKHHREALWAAVRDGVVDVLGSDHAPHTLDEKHRNYPNSPSGMPGVQTMLPVMLEHVHRGRLSLEHLVDLLCVGPARIYGIMRKGRIAVGYDADLTLCDLDTVRRIDNSWIASRCGWSPFHDTKVHGWPRATIVRGHVVMREDEVLGEAIGRPVEFLESLQ